MKKWLLVLGMITCMLGLTACGQEEEVKPLMTQEEADTLGRQVVETINQYVILQARDQVTDQVTLNALDSWEAAAEDMGDYVEIIGVESELGEKDGVIDIRVKGSVREAIVEIVIERNAITTISTNVEYTFGEKMEKAALNTLLGMGTVFCVLILISLIIGCFGFIPKIQAKFTKAPAKPEVKAAPVAAPAVNAAVQEEDLTDDLELVAVIAAAIAASEGASSTDGFVVRSIRRAGNKWQRA
ncbi:OadG family protein [Parablautia muri]|nr:OadG family protein [Parablautia muri]